MEPTARLDTYRTCMIASAAMGKPAAAGVMDSEAWLSRIMSDMARKRWAGTSKAKRRRIALKMVAARRKRRRLNNEKGRT